MSQNSNATIGSLGTTDVSNVVWGDRRTNDVESVGRNGYFALRPVLAERLT